MFIMNPWNKTISYGETMKAEMRAREQAIKNFFQNVDVAIREAAGQEAQTAAKWEVRVQDKACFLQDCSSCLSMCHPSCCCLCVTHMHV